MTEVIITPQAGLQIARHYDLLNEDVIKTIILSSPHFKRRYYDKDDPTRFAITAIRKDRRGRKKLVLLRVAESNPLPGSIYKDNRYVVLLIHVEESKEGDSNLI